MYEKHYQKINKKKKKGNEAYTHIMHIRMYVVMCVCSISVLKKQIHFVYIYITYRRKKKTENIKKEGEKVSPVRERVCFYFACRNSR